MRLRLRWAVWVALSAFGARLPAEVAPQAPAGGESDSEEMIRNLDFFYYMDAIDTEAMVSLAAGQAPSLSLPNGHGAGSGTATKAGKTNEGIPDAGAQKIQSP
jgi:hypothetical protein